MESNMETVKQGAGVYAFDFSEMGEKAEEASRLDLSFCDNADKAVAHTKIALRAFKKLHDLMADYNNGGIWGRWLKERGINKDEAARMLRRHDFVFANCENADYLLELSTSRKSLVDEAARPSTPQALKDGVAQGDITTLAEFRDMKARLSAAQDAAARSDAARVAAVDAASEAQTKAANMAELLAAEQRGRKEAERSAEQLTRMATSLRATIERQASELANRPERETVVVPDDYETLKRNCESLEKENAELKAHSQGMSVQELAESDPAYAKHGRTHEESAKAAQAVAEALDKIDRLPFNDYEMQEYGRCFLDYSIQREETLAHVQAVIERAQRKFELLADVFSYGPKLKAVK